VSFSIKGVLQTCSTIVDGQYDCMSELQIQLAILIATRFALMIAFEVVWPIAYERVLEPLWARCCMVRAACVLALGSCAAASPVHRDVGTLQLPSPIFTPTQCNLRRVAQLRAVEATMSPIERAASLPPTNIFYECVVEAHMVAD